MISIMSMSSPLCKVVRHRVPENIENMLDSKQKLTGSFNSFKIKFLLFFLLSLQNYENIFPFFSAINNAFSSFLINFLSSVPRGTFSSHSIKGYRGELKTARLLRNSILRRIWIIPIHGDPWSIMVYAKSCSTFSFRLFIPDLSLAFSDFAISGAAARGSAFLVYVYPLFEPVSIKRCSSIRMFDFYRLSVDRSTFILVTIHS